MKKIVFALLIVLSIPLMAFSQGYNGYGGHHRGYNNGRRGYGNCCYGRGYNGKGYGYNRGHNYTQEQMEAYNDIKVKYSQEIRELRSAIDVQSSIIRSELTKDTPNQNKINSAINERASLNTELDKLKIQMRMEMDKVS